MAALSTLTLSGVPVTTMVLCAASPAWSHHSHAMFDRDKVVTKNGTVNAWLFRNPHVFLYVDVKQENGETV